MATEEYHESRLRGGSIISNYASASCDCRLSSWDILTSTKRPFREEQWDEFTCLRCH